MSESPGSWLHAAHEVAFAEIEAHFVGSDSTQRTRALTATVIAIGAPPRLEAAARALAELGASTAVRAILISPGALGTPVVHIAEDAVVLEGLKPAYINNAVAALRLSSLPTLVWWRGGEIEMLDGLARLADRLVIDAEEPEPAWRRALTLLDRTAFSDLRWARLTRWRALMAHFFDIAAVREAAPRFTTVTVRGTDRPCAALFAAWLNLSLNLRGGVRTELEDRARAPIDEVIVAGEGVRLSVRITGNGSCVETSAAIDGQPEISRMASIGNQNVAALLTEELRVRSRDLSFERAMRAAVASS